MIDVFWEADAARGPKVIGREAEEHRRRLGLREVWIAARADADMDRCRMINDILSEAVRGNDGLRWIAAVSPTARGADDEIARAAEAGAVGVGELDASALRWNVGDSRETWRLAASCHELGLFALVRAALDAGDGARGAATEMRCDANGCCKLVDAGGEAWPAATAGDIESMARSHPELVIVATDLGAGIYLRGKEHMEGELPNVWLATCGAEEHVCRAAESAAPGRTLYACGLDRRAHFVQSFLQGRADHLLEACRAGARRGPYAKK